MRSIRDNVSVGAPLAIFNSIPIAATSGVVDTKGYTTAMLYAMASTTGNAANNIGSSTVAVLQESASATTGFATANDNGGTAIGFTLVATTSVVAASARIEGLGLTRLRYLRFTLTSNFPAGANTPSALIHTVSAGIALARAFNLPVSATPGTTAVVVSNT